MLWTYDKTSTAVKVLKEAPQLFKKFTSQQEVLFVLGRIEEEKRQPLKALAIYDKALKEPTTSLDVQIQTFCRLLATTLRQILRTIFEIKITLLDCDLPKKIEPERSIQKNS